uniref:Uncharacterized protein n=1 Tax=Chrysemys picta bellii TaxID=8478 RepID=A0A8C3FAR6_CHRPI
MYAKGKGSAVPSDSQARENRQPPLRSPWAGGGVWPPAGPGPRQRVG